MKHLGETYTVTRNREVSFMASARQRWGLPGRANGYVEIADIHDGLVVMQQGSSWLLLDLFRARQAYPRIERPRIEVTSSERPNLPRNTPALPPFVPYKVGSHGQIALPASAGKRWNIALGVKKVQEIDLGSMVLVTPLDKAPSDRQEIDESFVSPFLQQAARATPYTLEMVRTQQDMYHEWCKKMGAAALDRMAAPYLMPGNGLAADESLLGRTLEANVADYALKAAREILRSRNPDIPSLLNNG